MAGLTYVERARYVEEYAFERVKRNYHMNNSFVVIFSKISGYHHFHKRPLTGCRMLMDLIREPENPYDRYAVRVRAPQLNAISQTLWDTETKPMPKRQTVRDVAGRWVGRVPLALTKIISSGIESQKIVHAHAICTDVVLQEGCDISGGPKLSSAYFLEIRNNDIANEISSEFLNIADAVKHENLA